MRGGKSPWAHLHCWLTPLGSTFPELPEPIGLASLLEDARRFGIEAGKLYAKERLERMREREQLELSIVRRGELL